MSKDVILLAAVGLGVWFVMDQQKLARMAQRQAQQVQGGYINPGNIPAAGVKTSVNGDMWARLLGQGFTSLVGGLRTSDGKPVSDGDPIANFYHQLQAGDAFSMPDNVLGTGGDLLTWGDEWELA